MTGERNFSIEVNGLSVAYEHKRVLSNIYLKIEPGYVYGLIGPNGAGKSKCRGNQNPGIRLKRHADKNRVRPTTR